MTKWFYHSNGEQHGPFEEAEMIKLASSGTLKPTDKVWNASMGKQWADASTIPAIFPASDNKEQKKGLRLKKQDEPKPTISDEPAAGAQPVVMQHLNAARQSEQARARKNSPARRILKLALPAILVAGAAFAAAKYFMPEKAQNASIEYVVAAGGMHLQQMPVIWVSMIFNTIPESGDPKDVRIILKSPCFLQDMVFDWPAIAANPFVRPSPDSTKKKPAEGISPGEPPRLNYQFDAPLRIPIEGLHEKLDASTNLRLTAELYWAGQKMHSKSCSVRNWYVAE
jgi:hypothetical protein